jgi:acetyl esterase
VYFHGGGLVLGNFGTHERLVRELAEQTGAAFVFVNDTPSPGAHYPLAIEEAHAATVWLAEHGAQYGLDGTRMAVAGDSVGGDMTAAVTLLAKERGGPATRFQARFYPVTLADSYDEFADGPWLTRRRMKWFRDAYTPDPARRIEPTASPLLASLEQLADLPPALIITDEADVLRDEGEAYGRKLRQAGVDVTAVRYEGIFHDVMMLNALAETNATQAAIAQAAQALRAALSKPLPNSSPEVARSFAVRNQKPLLPQGRGWRHILSTTRNTYPDGRRNLGNAIIATTSHAMTITSANSIRWSVLLSWSSVATSLPL